MSTLNGRATLDVEAHTTSDTLTATETGTYHTNTGASGAITFTLPSATVGLRFGFAVGVAQELRIDPSGSQTISLPSDGVPSAAGAYITANAIGERVDIACLIAGNWSVLSYSGTWTAV
jgi:hypothetical protein